MAATDTVTNVNSPIVLLGMNPMADLPAGESLFVWAPIAALLASITGGKVLVSYDFSVTLNASLLTGRQTATATITGLQTTDRVVEIQPLSDLPGNLTVGYGYISATNTLKIAFTTPVLYTGNTSIPMRLSVLR